MLLINKPKGPTSHDIVDEVRHITGERRVGHAGTLDPFAEGLLIVLVGREETKRQAEFLNMDKVYEATLTLGIETDTFDLTGKPVKSQFSISNSQFSNNFQIPISKIRKALRKFEGEQMQMPPDFSAKKIKGKKAYELARAGKKVELSPKKIEVYWIKLLEYNYPNLKIETKVSSGTYIRAIARDIGRELKVGAYASGLKRTEIGSYKLENALTTEDLRKKNIDDIKQ